LSVDPGTTLDSPHNWVLQALSAGGLPLALLAVGLAVAAAIVGFSRWRSAVAFAKPDAREVHLAGSGVALLALGVALLTHFTSPGTTLLAAVLLGSLLAVDRSPARDGTSMALQLGRVVRVLLAGAWVIFL